MKGKTLSSINTNSTQGSTLRREKAGLIMRGRERQKQILDNDYISYSVSVG